MTVYLAGPITGETYGTAIGWREFAAEFFRRLGWRVLSPMRGTEDLGKALDGGTITATHGQASWITARDRGDVWRADLMFVNLGGVFPSIGTMIELGWASARGIPIVAVDIAAGMQSVAPNHPMVRTLTSFQSKSFDEALVAAATWDEPDKTRDELVGLLERVKKDLEVGT